MVKRLSALLLILCVVSGIKCMEEPVQICKVVSLSSPSSELDEFEKAFQSSSIIIDELRKNQSGYTQSDIEQIKNCLRVGKVVAVLPGFHLLREAIRSNSYEGFVALLEKRNDEIYIDYEGELIDIATYEDPKDLAIKLGRIDMVCDLEKLLS